MLEREPIASEQSEQDELPSSLRRKLDRVDFDDQMYGYKATFNPTFPIEPNREFGWVSLYHFGLISTLPTAV
jgi:hypothetical protein